MMTLFDIDTRGELRASGQVTVRRPTFIASWVSVDRVSQRTGLNEAKKGLPRLALSAAASAHPITLAYMRSVMSF